MRIFIASIVAIFGIMMCVMVLNLPKSPHVHYITIRPIINVVGYDEPFTEKNLKEYVKKLNLKYPDLVVKQIKQESDHFKSDIFKENNNLFGMKWSSQRPHTCVGLNNSHAVYNSWKESVLDFALYEAKYLSRCKTKAEYLMFLQKYYAKDPAYSSKIVKIE